MPSSTQSPPARPFARNRLLRDASWKAVYDAMTEDPSVHVFGEGAAVKAHYDAPDIERDYAQRVHTMPISEDGNVNFAVGAALMGVKPLVDIIAADFLYRAMDSICNTAAKINDVGERGRVPVTMVIRAEFLTGGPTTGQRPEALFAHVPGLHVMVPSTPRDAYSMMRQALRGPGVTLYFEDREIDDSGPWLDGDLTVGEHVGSGIVKRWMPMSVNLRMAPVATVVTYGRMRQTVERAVGPWLSAWDGDYYAQPNYAVDILDLRSVYPLDTEYLLNGRYRVSRTNRLLIVEPDVVHGGVGAEIIAQLAERLPGLRYRRLGAKRYTVSASPARVVYPTEEEVRDAITALANAR